MYVMTIFVTVEQDLDLTTVLFDGKMYEKIYF